MKNIVNNFNFFLYPKYCAANNITELSLMSKILQLAVIIAWL